jgi:hypothetical protein
LAVYPPSTVQFILGFSQKGWIYSLKGLLLSQLGQQIWNAFCRIDYYLAKESAPSLKAIFHDYFCDGL